MVSGASSFAQRPIVHPHASCSSAIAPVPGSSLPIGQRLVSRWNRLSGVLKASNSKALGAFGRSAVRFLFRVNAELDQTKAVFTYMVARYSYEPNEPKHEQRYWFEQRYPSVQEKFNAALRDYDLTKIGEAIDEVTRLISEMDRKNLFFETVIAKRFISKALKLERELEPASKHPEMLAKTRRFVERLEDQIYANAAYGLMLSFSEKHSALGATVLSRALVYPGVAGRLGPNLSAVHSWMISHEDRSSDVFEDHLEQLAGMLGKESADLRLLESDREALRALRRQMAKRHLLAWFDHASSGERTIVSGLMEYLKDEYYKVSFHADVKVAYSALLEDRMKRLAKDPGNVEGFLNAGAAAEYIDLVDENDPNPFLPAIHSPMSRFFRSLGGSSNAEDLALIRAYGDLIYQIDLILSQVPSGLFATESKNRLSSFFD